MVFLKNGKFIEIKNRTCNYDRENYTGTWEIKDNIISIKINQTLIWYFKIYRIDDFTFCAEYRIEKK